MVTYLMGQWRPWTGGPCPDTGGNKVLVRLRSDRTREIATFNQVSRPPEKWPRWSHDGGPGDIIEIREENSV